MSDVELHSTRAPRGRGRRIAVAGGAVAVLAGGLFAAASLAGDDGNSPEAPVRAFLASVEDGDALGALEQLLPAERDAVRDSLVDLVDELNRLEVLDTDLGDVSGVEVDFEGVELASEVDGDLARVTASGGRVSYAVGLAGPPLGDFLRDLLGDDLPAAERGSSEIEESDDFLVTVERGGRWYLSFGYTLAEQARVARGTSLEDLGPGVAATGAESPEAAVESFLRSAAALDLEAVLGGLSPDLEPLRRYAGLFLDGTEGGLLGMAGALDLEIGEMTLDSEVDGDRALVRVEDVELSGTVGGRPVDEDALGGLGAQLGVPAAGLPSIGDGEEPDLGVVVVRDGGRWFVSPVGTTLDGLVAVLRVFDGDDLQEVAELLTGGFGSLLRAPIEAALGRG